MTFANSKYVRCCKTVKNDIKIIGSEDGLISLVKAHEIIQNEYDDELKEKDIFMEEEKNEEDLHKKVFFSEFYLLFIHKNRKSSKTIITSSTLSEND